MSDVSKKLIEQARKLSEKRQQNIIDQIGRFLRLDITEWKGKVGPNAVVYDTGHNDEHGAEGTIAVVSGDDGLLIGYVWDSTVQLKRWISVRTLEPEAAEVDDGR